MKDFEAGILVGMILIFFVMVIGMELTDMTHPVTYEQSLEAVAKCSNGEWDKIGEDYIYCKDGGKYELENN